jgi:hypothetical protein
MNEDEKSLKFGGNFSIDYFFGTVSTLPHLGHLTLSGL